MTVYRCTTQDVSQLNDQIYRIRVVPDDLELLDFNGGQYIILIDELDLIVVVTGHDDNSTLQITAERILPAFAD